MNMCLAPKLVNRRSDLPQAEERAFTLLELTMILGILALLTFVSIPAFSRSQPVNRTLQCLNNNRQLCNAWRMYADDNRDQIVFSSDDGSTSGNPLNQYAWTQGHMDLSPVNRVNWDPASLTNSPLWPYCGGRFDIFKCPSDRLALLVNGVYRPRIRTMSMNLYLGGFAGTTGGWPSMQSYRLFLKSTELSAPGPARTFVFLDMRPDYVNWGNFFTDMTGYSPSNPGSYLFQDFPGYFHDGGCGFSFADNHVELRRWVDPRTIPAPYSALSTLYSPRNLDIAWLQDRATALK